MSTILLGIDPGLVLGWGVVAADGPRVRHMAHGVVATERNPLLRVQADLGARVALLEARIGELVAEHHPDGAGMEEFGWQGRNVTSGIKVANVVGALRALFRARGVPCVELGVQEIKQAVTGYRNADKRQVQRMVQLILGMEEFPRPQHAADALAAAIASAGRLRLEAAAKTTGGIVLPGRRPT